MKRHKDARDVAEMSFPTAQSSASAMYADSTTAETTAETTTDGFDADELRLALEASTKETSADVLAVELKFDVRGRGTSDAETARSAGRSLAAKFWISQALDAEDVLDASADGFYDVHGDAFDAMENGKLPELHELLRRPSTRGEEALVVDRRTDMFLSELDVLARETCDAAPTASAKCALLARLVSDRLGGSVRAVDDPALAADVANDRETLLGETDGCCLHVGHLSKGSERHRAVLFKALAATCGIPCRLVRGEYYCGRDSARVIFTEGEREMWIDLMVVPGRMTSCTEPEYDGAPPTPPPYVPPRASEATTEWSFSKAKGKSPLLEKFPKSPLFADENSDSSIEDLVAFARNGAASTSTSTVNAKPVDKGKGPGDAVNDDVLAAIAVAHGITLKSAVSASKLAENDSERANYLCNALGAVLEDENELNDVESPYTETVLLQEMFNLLVTKKWIVSDAVGAFRARRRLEIESKALAARESARAEEEELERRRREQKNQASIDLIRAAEKRVEKFRAEQVKSSEEAQSAEELRHEFRAKWTGKVREMNLAETLECFGVDVEGGAHANAKQLRRAYRKALLKFHPDRQRAGELHARIAAEETFKIIADKIDS